MRKLLTGLVAAAALSIAPTLHSQGQAPTELFISEYIEGTSFNKAIEIYNGTGANIDLAAGGYNIQMYFNGAVTAQLTINLVGTVVSGDVFVLTQTTANAVLLAQADQTNGSSWYNGDDTVVLRRGTTIIDAIGQAGFDPGTEWGTGLISTLDNTIRRRASVCRGDAIETDVFDPASEWEGFAVDTFDGIGSHTATCATTTDTAPLVTTSEPGGGSTDFPLNGTLSVTFSEPVDVAADGFALSCGISGSVPMTRTGGPTTFTLDPDADLVFGEACTFTVRAAAVTDQDTADPPNEMAADYTVGFTTSADPCTVGYTPIYLIQGSGASAAITGLVTTQGVVVGDHEGPSPALRGFFIQDPSGDGDPATSDAIFVFDGSNANRVSVGDLVRVTGTAGEFQGQTQISLTAAPRTCGTGTVEPVNVTIPFGTADDPERFEGMLVRLPQTLTVTEHFQLGRFGQVTLSSGGRLAQPTSVTAPGASAQALQAANNLNRIVIDDSSQAQNPDPIVFGRGGQPLSAANTLRGGDTVTGVVGVMNFTWAGNAASPNTWRVRPVGALGGSALFDPANPRPDSAPDVGGSLRVASMNLLNYFNTFAGCTAGIGGAGTDCRGADDAVEFERQWPKAVQAVLSTGADVVGVIEVENDGYGVDSALADLVTRLNAATAPGTYAYVDVDAGTGQVNALGTDAIKVGVIFKPARVVPVGSTAVLNTVSFVNGGDAEPRNRPALAQAFQTPAGGRFVAVINHFKSKGSVCGTPDAGDGQGDCNAVRTAAATELMAWLASDPTGSGEQRVLVLGDLNAYAQEDPVSAIRSAGYTDLITDLNGASSYSYAFDGQWGYLDHALASPALRSQVTGVAEYHINADEPSVLDYNDDFKSAGQIVSLYAPDQFRAADHDPIVVGLDIDPVRGGQVTAAGWLDQPLAGARRWARGWLGKVSFALTAYDRGEGSDPKGAVLVRFERGTIFVGTAIQWVTVEEGRAVLQGSGAVGRDGAYGFRIVAVDGRQVGGADQLAIQIWSTLTGEVVFDSGAPANIKGGTVVVRDVQPR